MTLIAIIIATLIRRSCRAHKEITAYISSLLLLRQNLLVFTGTYVSLQRLCQEAAVLILSLIIAIILILALRRR